MKVKELMEILSKLEPDGIVYITDPASLYYKQIRKETGEFESDEIMSYGKEEDVSE